MIILNVSGMKEVTQGLVLPKILTNHIPRDCQLIKLVDYLGVKYMICVENMGHRNKKIPSSQWIQFLECHKHKNIAKLCFKKLKEAKFEVSVLSDEGFEIRKDGNRKDYVHDCLVRTSEETYYKKVKDLPHGLLWLLSDRQLKIDHLLAKVHGPKQSSTVDVCYVFTPENPKGLAAGFMGSGWTTFCFENEIEEGCQSLFQWMGSTPADHFVTTPVPYLSRERAAANLVAVVLILINYFGSGNFIRTVVRKYVIRVKPPYFILITTWVKPKFLVTTCL
ncbi:hypothetical protein HanIR_Chr09g0429111 [Helianthus annuus]|nr:hypothetical protein HanIR_Chr09g0429111 [Helianthus annuus]